MAEAAVATPVEAAADKIRETANWVIGAFGAIGAALAASIPFTDLGKETGADLVLALIGLAAAFTGVAVAIWNVAKVRIPRARTLGELARAESDDPAARHFAAAPELLTPFTTLSRLHEAREEQLRSYRTQFERWQSAAPRDETEEAKKLIAAHRRAAPIEATSARVITWANYETLRDDYGKAIRNVFRALALTLLGLVLFVLSVQDPPTAAPPAVMTGAQLADADLSSSNLRNVNLAKANLRGADFTHADLRGAVLSRALLDGADFTGANLRGANLDGASVSAVTWSDTQCPDGSLSSALGDTCEAHLTADE